jgi:hypothetical protein
LEGVPKGSFSAGFDDGAVAHDDAIEVPPENALD